jgi:phosphate transport system protein
MRFGARHTSRAYEAELEELRTAAVAMGDLCRQALGTALDAFHGGSHDLARRVQEFDRRVDDSEMAIDALVLRILALRQPVASDLRLLTMTLKLVTDLERIGDEAVNIAERAIDERCEPDAKTRSLLEQMSAETQRMLSTALDAFVAGDGERAEEVLAHDDIVDELYGQTMRGMEEYMMRHPADIRAALSVMSVAKYLERVADHATNIAEEVIFVVRGDDVRHHGSLVAPRSERVSDPAGPG